LTPRGVSAILLYSPQLRPQAFRPTNNSFEPIMKTTLGDEDACRDTTCGLQTRQT
jgi:hypothetical protein